MVSDIFETLQEQKGRYELVEKEDRDGEPRGELDAQALDPLDNEGSEHEEGPGKDHEHEILTGTKSTHQVTTGRPPGEPLPAGDARQHL